MEGRCISGELSVEAGCRLARCPTRVQIGTGDRDGSPGGQSGSTASWA